MASSIRILSILSFFHCEYHMPQPWTTRTRWPALGIIKKAVSSERGWTPPIPSLPTWPFFVDAWDFRSLTDHSLVDPVSLKTTIRWISLNKLSFLLGGNGSSWIHVHINSIKFIYSFVMFCKYTIHIHHILVKLAGQAKLSHGLHGRLI